MIQWFVDKNNKVPLYLQLRDLIKYYISTGAIQADHQLPAVNALADDLGINFETIRKAYKELEKDGLVSMKRGRGTFVILHNAPLTPATSLTSAEAGMEASLENGLVAAAKSMIKKYLQNGISPEEAKRMIDQAFHEISIEGSRQEIIFTECNTLQIKEISQLLNSHLNRPVKPVLLKDLKDEIQKLSAAASKAPSVITTGFHVNEVRDALRGLPVSTHVLITNMSFDTRLKLEAFGKEARFGFICRDQESILLYKDILKVEMNNPDLRLACCILEEESKVKDLLGSVDVLLVSPPVYQEIKKLAPPELPVFNVFDRIDPMSLKMIKDKILYGDRQSAGQMPA